MINLNGKKALVTGSSRGIGLTIAKGLLRQGCRVVLNSRRQADLDLVVKQYTDAFGIAADLTVFNEATSLLRRTCDVLGGLDILVCNVGSGKSVAPGREDPEEWSKMMSINLFSATNAVEAAKDELIKSRGSIICISSICGIECIEGAPVAYSAAKAALNAYVKGVARPFGKRGVRVNAIAPGNILFPGSVWETKENKDPKAVKSMLDDRVALSRFGKAEEIANLVTFLASDASEFITGNITVIDGGQVH